MKRTLTIENHVGFQWTVLRTTLAGGLLGLVHSLFGSTSGYLAEITGLRGSWAWLYGATAVALMGSAAVMPKSRRQQLWLLSCCTMGAVAGGMGARWGWSSETWAQLGTLGVAGAIGLQLATGLGLWRGLGALALGTVATYLAQRVPAALGAQDAFLELPHTVGTMLSGLGVGFVVGGASIMRHVKVVRSTKLDRELRALLTPAQPGDELAELVQSAVTSYQQATEALAETLDDQAQAKLAASELVKKIARFGKKWQDIDAQTRKSDRPMLERRLADITARHDAATDEGVRTEYSRTLSALREQLSYLAEIEKGRQRAIARLHHQVATLDRLRLAAVRHRSVGAAKLGEELKGVVEELNQAGQDLDTAAELAELPG